jgi:hypothetical protein
MLVTRVPTVETAKEVVRARGVYIQRLCLCCIYVYVWISLLNIYARVGVRMVLMLMGWEL